MSAHHSKVIGYFAYESPTMLVCTGEACVIAGSRRAMTQYILNELEQRLFVCLVCWLSKR